MAWFWRLEGFEDRGLEVQHDKSPNSPTRSSSDHPHLGSMRNKSSKRVDPLRAKAALRIEKPRRPQRDGRNLPSWYYRVLGFSYKGHRDVKPWDFDEDISDLEEDKTQAGDDDKQLRRGEEDEGEEKDEGEEDCECDEEDCECDGEDPDCSCQSEGDDHELDEDDDVESERSYDGSDADYYYELKEMREERKREMLMEKLEYQKEKEQALEEERAMEKEILAAHKSLKKGKKQRNKTRLDPLAGQEFKIFCSDYIDHFYIPPCGTTKRVDFYRLDGGSEPILGQPEPGSEADMVYGDMYLDSNTHCDFGPLRPPKRASRKAVKVKASDGKHELSFKFIGNGYLELNVSREFVSTARGDPCPPDPPLAAPEVFKFVGIKRDREKEKAERQELARVAKARRSPSPPETWFEMNHPMGWWHSGYL